MKKLFSLDTLYGFLARVGMWSLFSFADFLAEFYFVDFFTLSQGFTLLE
jgi:hypothetical protein